MTLKRAFWAVFSLTLLVYLAMVLWSLPIISADADGLLPFDLRPQGYSAKDARQFLSALSEAGRAQYLGWQHFLDSFYPGLMALSLALAYFLLFPKKWAAAFSALAVLAAVFDWRENHAVADMLRAGAASVDDEAISLASGLTQLKSATVTVAVTILLLGLVKLGWNRWKGRAS
ncbi:hypothetical protein [Aliiroseovarius sp. PrR006]|uniref:hypothetical protein n=1 Tax=Aliiroseovarius sp. PrR006 TaxID=2706883 RepID=UPI0013D4DDC1|nr:hypothetical protein [Aliiroseovarius sp. PrR006]NDW53230.1 hypothetical protein [Aliiroseovarius sp. PrR006]